MFVHLGGDTVIAVRKVVAICDLEMARQARCNEEFLRTLKDRGRVIDISEGKEKSFVVTDDGVYISQISALTLKKRAEGLFDYLDNLND